MSSLNKFDDPTIGRKTKILTLNTSELSQLGDVQGLYVWRNMSIAGTKSALIGTLDDTMRGSLISYNFPSTDMLK